MPPGACAFLSQLWAAMLKVKCRSGAGLPSGSEGMVKSHSLNEIVPVSAKRRAVGLTLNDASPSAGADGACLLKYLSVTANTRPRANLLGA